MTDIERLKLLLEIDKDVQPKIKEYETFAGYGIEDDSPEAKIIVNWDNYVTREIYLFLRKETDIE